jgi:hypothetical protein
VSERVLEKSVLARQASRYLNACIGVHARVPSNARKLNKVSGNPDNQRFLHVAASQHACRTPTHSLREIDDEIRNSYASFKFAARRAPFAFAFSGARERGTAAN